GIGADGRYCVSQTVFGFESNTFAPCPSSAKLGWPPGPLGTLSLSANFKVQAPRGIKFADSGPTYTSALSIVIVFEVAPCTCVPTTRTTRSCGPEATTGLV